MKFYLFTPWLLILACGTSAPSSNDGGTDEGDAASDVAGDVGADATTDANGLLCQAVTVSTLSGNGVAGFFDGTGAASGTTEFWDPIGVAFDGNGNVYVADRENGRIRKVALDGSTTTLTGSGSIGFKDGAGSVATFAYPEGVAVDSSGNVYVADAGNNRIRKVAPDGTTSTLAGNGTKGFVDGTGGPTGTTEFISPSGIAVDGSGTVYVADTNNNRIRKVAHDGATTTLAGNGTSGYADGTGGANGTTEFANPQALVVDQAGYVYVADYGNKRIRKVAPDGTTVTFAGDGTDDAWPRGVAVDPATGFVYVADEADARVHRVPPGGTTGAIESTDTVAGGSPDGFQDGVGCDARFLTPWALALLGPRLVVGDVGNVRVREVTLP